MASVVGRVFAYRIVRDVHPVEADKPQILDHLNKLNRLDITPIEIPEPNLSYAFKHVVTQEVAYNLMVYAQRDNVHQSVAEWFEREFSGDLSPFFPLLAYHWHNCSRMGPERAAKAIYYLERAGEQAINKYANREAVGFFRQA